MFQKQFRTNTLPRLKQKFLLKQNKYENIEDQQQQQQQQSIVQKTTDDLLIDAFNEVLKSLDYLLCVIERQKYEIISDALTFLLESIIQVYNYIDINSDSNNNNEQLTAITKRNIDSNKEKVNFNLAKLLKLYDFKSVINKEESMHLIKYLINLINKLIKLKNQTGNSKLFKLKRNLSDSKLNNSLSFSASSSSSHIIKEIDDFKQIIDNLSLEVNNTNNKNVLNIKKFENNKSLESISSDSSSSESSEASSLNDANCTNAPVIVLHETLDNSDEKNTFIELFKTNKSNNEKIKMRYWKKIEDVVTNDSSIPVYKSNDSIFITPPYTPNNQSNIIVSKNTNKNPHIDNYMGIFRELINHNSAQNSPNLSKINRKCSLSELNGRLTSASASLNNNNNNNNSNADNSQICGQANVASSLNLEDLFKQTKIFSSSSDESLKTTSTSASSSSTVSIPKPTTPNCNKNRIETIETTRYAIDFNNLKKGFNENISVYSKSNELNLLDIEKYLEYQTTEQLKASTMYHLNSNTQLTPTVPSAFRGGSIDALIVLATSAEKKDFLYQEAFLTTYRTMLDSKELIYKLLYRYRLFAPSNNDKLKRRAAKNSFSLLVRVLDELANFELNDEIIEIFQNFVFELIINDQLQLARILRKKLLDKIENKFHLISTSDFSIIPQLQESNQQQHIDLIPLTTLPQKRFCLLDFKSIDIAEQMTTIDMDLFLKIELSEILLWSTKQCSDLSPNLTKFTEHFNNVSYWTRTRILEQENPKDREKYVEKFLKITKYLRKLNNFNSYLAIISALDSNPIQRLDWPKYITDTIKEYALLIDPKCGFKRLREAVAHAEPPCIPHIGLILQDLTILHIANSDFLSSGNCNFWKRWQQFNMLERLRYFRNCQYNFKRNLKIISFVNNFNDFICEDAQYSLSERIKPKNKV